MLVERTGNDIAAHFEVPLLAESVYLLRAYIDGAVMFVNGGIIRQVGRNLHLEQVDKVLTGGEETIRVTFHRIILIHITEHIAHQALVALIIHGFTLAVNAVSHLVNIFVERQTVFEFRNTVVTHIHVRSQHTFVNCAVFYNIAQLLLLNYTEHP